MRRRVWKIWQKWLRLSIPLNLICWIVCACCLDSKSIIPAIVCLVSGLWLTLLVWANSGSRNNGKVQRYNREEIREIDCD